MVSPKGRLVLVIILLATQPYIYLATAQSSASQQLSPSTNLRSNIPPSFAFQPGRDVMALSKNRRNFSAGGPPVSLASTLAKADLPATSGKQYSLPVLSQVNLLAPKETPAIAFPSLGNLGLDKSRIRNTKPPSVKGTLQVKP